MYTYIYIYIYIYITYHRVHARRDEAPSGHKCTRAHTQFSLKAWKGLFSVRGIY